MQISRSNAKEIALGLAMTLAIAVPSLAAKQDAAHRRPLGRQTTLPAPTPPPVTLPPGPLVPLTLEQEPTSPPQVIYRAGQLTITAQNSTLGDVLRAVRTQTGAMVEVPGNPSDRVVGHFGPGPARDVLASLLNGSRYNYVLLGSASNPNALEHVILTASSGGGVASPPQGQGQNPEQAEQAAPQPGVFGGDAEQADDLGTLGGDNSDEAQPDADQQAADGQAAQADDTPQPGIPQPGVRSPQQLLQELQQRQQQGQGQIFQPSTPPAPGIPNQPNQSQ